MVPVRGILVAVVAWPFMVRFVWPSLGCLVAWVVEDVAVLPSLGILSEVDDLTSPCALLGARVSRVSELRPFRIPL